MSPYQVLQIEEGSPASVVKKAYRRLAQKFHPDRNKEPGAEERFKLIKEAYEFLTSGVSGSGKFGKKEPPPKAPPKRAEPDVVWPTGYKANNVPKAKVVVSFADAFTGVTATIPGTPYKVFVMPGTLPGYRDRRLVKLSSRDASYFDIEYDVIDPSGFYKFMMIDGAFRFCCHLEMTTGQLLGDFEHALQNVDPNSPPVTFKVPIDYGRHVVVPRAGPRVGINRHERMDLYVIPVVRTVPLEKEVYPVLEALNIRVQNALKTYRYFK